MMNDSSFKLYEGVIDKRGDTTVLVNGRPLPLTPSLKLMAHSPSGFSWGYHGSGPSQLALAILYDYYGDSKKSLRLYQHFKEATVALWPSEEAWTLTSNQLKEVCDSIEQNLDSINSARRR
jgi:Family of unknown function (DUF6166)